MTKPLLISIAEDKTLPARWLCEPCTGASGHPHHRSPLWLRVLKDAAAIGASSEGTCIQRTRCRWPYLWHVQCTVVPGADLDNRRSQPYRKTSMFDRRTMDGNVQTEHDDWLSDEVVVDFPSMAGVVERMRAAFFGAAADESRSTHTTEVKLTAREADEGAYVPFDLPVRHTCPVCGGRGEVWTETCGVCLGTGAGILSHHLQIRVPPGVRHGSRLKFSVNPPFAAETHLEVRIAIP